MVLLHVFYCKAMDFDKALIDMLPHLNVVSRRYGLLEDDRQDLISNTILKVLEKKDYFKEGGEDEFKAWVCTVMKNLMIDCYRKQVKNKTDNYDNEEFQLISEQKYYSEDSDSNILYQEMFDAIKSLINPIDFRIFMAHVNGYTYEQIAEILELPLGTVKSKIFIVRNKVINQIINHVKDKSRKRSKIH